MNRRHFLQTSLAATASTAFLQAAAGDFKFRYIVGSSMYGDLKLAEILPEVPKTGAEFIDVWPKKHGTQREQIDEMGHEAFQQLLAKNGVKLGCSTRYDLGPFGLQEEMQTVGKLGGDLLICGGRGPKDLKGEELKAAVKKFAEELMPHAAAAGAAGVRIGIENHAQQPHRFSGFLKVARRVYAGANWDRVSPVSLGAPWAQRVASGRTRQGARESGL